MFKKIASIALAATMLGTTAVIANAAEVDNADVAAQDQSAVGADASSEAGADASSEVSSGNVIKFDVTTTGWNMDVGKRCMAYIYEMGQDAVNGWGSKATRMTDTDKDGVWEYDLDKGGIKVESGKYYAVIFSNEAGAQTADLLFDSSCLGDTAIVKDKDARQENTADSNKKSYVAYWKSGKFGPLKGVTSIGNVVGDVVAPNTSAYAMFVDFLKNTLDNARQYSGKDDQTLIDDTAKALELGQDDVEAAIKESGVSGIKWEKAKSKANTGSNSAAKSNGGGSGSSGSNGGSSNTNTNTGTKTTTGSGSSSSGSGTKTTGSVSSGESTTIYFILGGVMLAAVGIAFLSRKRKMD